MATALNDMSPIVRTYLKGRFENLFPFMYSVSLEYTDDNLIFKFRHKETESRHSLKISKFESSMDLQEIVDITVETIREKYPEEILKI